MSVMMEEEIQRWTARRKSALVLEINQGKTTVSEAGRQFDLAPSEIGTMPRPAWRTRCAPSLRTSGARAKRWA